jgi:hypothetical protein
LLFAKTFAAVHRSTITGLKGNFGVLATLGTYRRVHLALSATESSTALSFFCLSAWCTTLGLIGKSLGLIEFLLFNGKRE